MKTMIWAAPVMLAGLAACDTGEDAAPMTDEDAAMETAEQDSAGQFATAMLRTSEGEDVGTATIRAEGDALMISVNAQGLSAGDHGAHVHMTGSCEAPDFTSAGGHWNPEEQQHGLEDPAGQHAGDMPNLTIAEDGTGALEYTLQGGTFDGLFDADGSAFVIHAGADDQVTDPSGNSGARVACGVFERGAA